jgi:hypothetical protein
MKVQYAVILAVLLSGCSSGPVKIGGNTYYATKSSGAGMFGNAGRVASDLMVQGNQFCDKQGREFELVSQHTMAGYPGSPAKADITYRCVEQSRDRNMRPDKGVSTVELR